MTERIGFWIDLDDAYYTFTNDYIETVWWLLRQIWDKGLLYQGFKVVPYCPRCGTRHQQPRGGAGLQGRHRGLRLRALPAGRRRRRPRPRPRWRAPPTARPCRCAVLDDHALDAHRQRRPRAVRPDVDYALVESRGERFVLARDLVERGARRRRPWSSASSRAPSCSACDYEPPYQLRDAPTSARTSSSAPTTSPPPTAPASCTSRPAFGEDDMRVGRAERPARRQRRSTRRARFMAEVTPWAGVFVKDADPGIIADLKRARPAAGRRCPTSTAIRSAGAATRRCSTTPRPPGTCAPRPSRTSCWTPTRHVTWYPEHIKHGRFGEWLENNVDWALSPRPLLGHAAAGVALRAAAHALRGLHRRAARAGRQAACPTIWSCTGPTSTTSCSRCPRVRRRDASRARGHRRLVRLGLHAVRPVALPVRERRDVRRALPRRLHLPRPSTRRAAGSTACSPWPRSSTGRSSYKTRALPGPHPRRRGPEDEQEPRQRGASPTSILDRQGADALRWYMFTSSEPLVRRGASARDGRRGRAQVPAHAVEHLQLLHDLRQHRPLRPGRRGACRSPSARCWTAGC